MLPLLPLSAGPHQPQLRKRVCCCRSLTATYRSSLKVIVQRLVQQRSLAALLGAHQCDVDVVICPSEPLAPRRDGHRVGQHGDVDTLLRMQRTVAAQLVRVVEQSAVSSLSCLNSSRG